VLLINVAPQLGHAYNLLGRWLESIALLEQVRDFADARSYVSQAPRILAYLGEAYGLAGRTEEGRAALQRALDIARERGMRGHEAWALYFAGDSYTLCDPADAFSAHQYYSDAVALAHELEMRPLEAICYLASGQQAQKSGRRAEAREQLTRANEMFREMGMQSWLESAESALKTL
jgi:tetratricopeptide (TPR) repeat protein